MRNREGPGRDPRTDLRRTTVYRQRSLSTRGCTAVPPKARRSTRRTAGHLGLLSLRARTEEVRRRPRASRDSNLSTQPTRRIFPGSAFSFALDRETKPHVILTLYRRNIQILKNLATESFLSDIVPTLAGRGRCLSKLLEDEKAREHGVEIGRGGS